MPWILPKQLIHHRSKAELNHCNCAVDANLLPWQTEHQRLQLLSVEFDFLAAMSAGPVKLASV